MKMKILSEVLHDYLYGFINLILLNIPENYCRKKFFSGQVQLSPPTVFLDKMKSHYLNKNQRT